MGGQSVAFEFRTQDARLGHFLSIDPLTATTPWETPYAFAANSPIALINWLGLKASGLGDGDKGKKKKAKKGSNVLAHLLAKNSGWDGKQQIRLITCFGGYPAIGKPSTGDNLRRIFNVTVHGALDRVWAKPGGILVGGSPIGKVHMEGFKSFGKKNK